MTSVRAVILGIAFSAIFCLMKVGVMPTRNIATGMMTQGARIPVMSSFSPSRVRFSAPKFGSSHEISGFQQKLSFERSMKRKLTPARAVKQSFGSFEEMLKQFDLPVFVDFYATWCGPCQLMEKELEIVQTALRHKVQVVKIDTDQHPEIAAENNVYGLPTMALFKNGEQVWRIEGAMRATDLISKLEPLLAADEEA
ncbi:hypothetical protein AAMO2058_001601100 [Amorphochlora amoebiformis]